MEPNEIQARAVRRSSDPLRAAFSHEDVASCVARTLIRSDSRPFSSVITRACEGSAMYAS